MTIITIVRCKYVIFIKKVIETNMYYRGLDQWTSYDGIACGDSTMCSRKYGTLIKDSASTKLEVSRKQSDLPGNHAWSHSSSNDPITTDERWHIS